MIMSFISLAFLRDIHRVLRPWKRSRLQKEPLPMSDLGILERGQLLAAGHRILALQKLEDGPINTTRAMHYEWAETVEGLVEEARLTRGQLDVALAELRRLHEAPAYAAEPLYCPAEVETASGVFDPAGYDSEDCAGCGTPRSEHTATPPPAEPAPPLETEHATFRDRLANWLRMGEAGRWVAVRCYEVMVGETEAEARRLGRERWGDVPMLVRRIEPEEGLAVGTTRDLGGCGG
jgi:hypothetical protein